MARPARLKKAIAKRRQRPSQQFGQSSDAYTSNGATGCTDTVLQWLAWLWTGRWYSQNQVRLMGTGTTTILRRGLRPSEVKRFCEKAKLPYVIRANVTATEVIEFSKRGPVAFGHSYSYWPEWKGFRYGGKVADGRPNGFAKPLEEAGRTQLVGFVPPMDAHFGLLLGRNPTSGNVFAWEPNHGSPARPEKPPFDYMTTAQFKAVFNSYKTVLGRDTYALIPTRSLPL